MFNTQLNNSNIFSNKKLGKKITIEYNYNSILNFDFFKIEFSMRLKWMLTIS